MENLRQQITVTWRASKTYLLYGPLGASDPDFAVGGGGRRRGLATQTGSGHRHNRVPHTFYKQMQIYTNLLTIHVTQETINKHTQQELLQAFTAGLSVHSVIYCSQNGLV